jgi:hypothetical protein
MVHFADGRQQLQRYGRDDSEVIWSVHRNDLNITLLQLAEQAGAQIHFYRRLHTVDFDAGYAALQILINVGIAAGTVHLQGAGRGGGIPAADFLVAEVHLFIFRSFDGAGIILSRAAGAGKGSHKGQNGDSFHDCIVF